MRDWFDVVAGMVQLLAMLYCLEQGFREFMAGLTDGR
jgi:hypothetical protein